MQFVCECLETREGSLVYCEVSIVLHVGDVEVDCLQRHGVLVVLSYDMLNHRLV